MLVSGEQPEDCMPACAICEHLALPPRNATGSVGLLTRFATLIDASVDQLGHDGDDQHVIVHACPEHVVDVYRGRVDGVRMAWRLPPEPTLTRRQPHAIASASRA